MGIKLNFANIKETTSTLERNPLDGYKTRTEYPPFVAPYKTASSWGNPTDAKVPLVLERDSLEGFQKEWEDWNDLSTEQKAASDRISLQLRNMTNREFFEEMLPILQKQDIASPETFTESMSFENMKSETELKHYVMSMVDDPVKKKKIKDMFDDFQNSALLSKNNLNFNKYAHMDRNDEHSIVAKVCTDIMTATSMALHTVISVVIQLGVAVVVVSAVILICLSILAGLVYGVIAVVFGITNIKQKAKWLADKFLLTTILANLKSIEGEVADKKMFSDIKDSVVENLGITKAEASKYESGKIIESIIVEDYNWDEMEFGLDAMNLDYDEDTLDDVDEYDKEFKDEESEFYNYAVEKEDYNDEEVDELIRRYLRIKDANTLGKVRNLFTDFRSAVRESAKKHGNFFIDTDEKDDEKDDKRMMTKAEAIAVVDATLASKYRMYLLAIEHFRRDSAKTLTFSLFTVILFTCIAISGLIVLLPITAVIGGTAAIGNWYAFFRDLKRTRLVIIKEIERIDNTVSRMSQEENPDKEKMKQLLEIKKALIIQAGYDEKSPKWQKLKDPAVVKKLTEMIDYFGDTMSIDDIRVNILEADVDNESEGDEPPEVDDETNKDPDEKDAEENPDEEKSNTGDEDFDEAQDDYLNSDPAEDAMNGSTAVFDAGGSEAEEKYKMNMCISNLSTLYDKYNELKRDLISSDTYKIVNENDKNRLKPIMSDLVNELGIALDNLKVYIEVGDKATYPIVAVKLSVHQNVLRVIDRAIAELVEKANKDIVETT